MRIIPAIDLKGKRCVRLVQGKEQNEISYGRDPVSLAEEFMRSGASIIHVIDLDGALTGSMGNFEIIKELAASYPIQVGGGIRSEERLEELLGLGVKKVILSTLLLKDQEDASRLKKKYSGKLIGSFDFKDGKLAYAGWTRRSDVSFVSAVAGLDEAIVTDVSRDGTFNGPNIRLIERLIEVTDAKIIAAGGTMDIEDLIDLRKTGADGVIVGRAFLENTISLREAFMLQTFGD
jgi:phosphoribosylformimino-5-aminoimidazole carboxamide ribotide isomerase